MIDNIARAARDSGVCDTEPDDDSSDWLEGLLLCACVAACLLAAAGIIYFNGI
jgi:hypothetical protein